MRSAPRSFMGGGLFLGCENTAGGGSSSRSSGGGTDASRSASSTNILGRTDINVADGDMLGLVLKKAGFLDSGKFTPATTPTNPDTNSPKQKFDGVLIKYPDGSTEYVSVKTDGSLAKDVPLKNGVQVTPVFAEGAIKEITVNIDGKKIKVPVSVANPSDKPTLKDVQDALKEQGIPLDLTGASSNNPKKSPYTYKGVASSGTTPMDVNAAITPGTELKPIFQKDVTAKVNIGDGSGEKPVINTETYGDPASQTVKLEDLLKGANGGTVPSAPTTADTNKKFGYWTVTTPDGQILQVPHDKIGTTDVPLGSKVEPTFVGKDVKTISLPVAGSSNKITVSVTVPNSSATTVKWSDIKNDPAITNPVAPVGVTGYIPEWRTTGDTTPVPDSTDITIADGSGVKLVWKKTLSYTIYYGGASPRTAAFDITYPTPDTKSLKDIFAQAKVDTNTTASPASGHVAVVVPAKSVFEGWKVTGETALLAPSEIDNNKRAGAASNLPNFPSGTVITAQVKKPHTISLGGNTSIEFTEIKTTSFGNYYVANTEITREQWKAVMLKPGKNTSDADGWYVDVTAYSNQARNNLKSNWNMWDEALNTGDSSNMNMPMNYVSWYDAVIFCNRLSDMTAGKQPAYYMEIGGEKVYDTEKWRQTKTADGGLYPPTAGVNAPDPEARFIYIDNTRNGFVLPSKEQWQIAAYGGEAKPYPMYSGTTGLSTADLGKVAWYNDNSGNKVHPVGEKGGDNPIRDMSGNVTEWTMETDAQGKFTHLYMGGPYNGEASLQRIDHITKDGQLYGKSSDRSPGMGIRIIEPIK